jgi:hypothetical protein
MATMYVRLSSLTPKRQLLAYVRLSSLTTRKIRLESLTYDANL